MASEVGNLPAESICWGSFSSDKFSTHNVDWNNIDYSGALQFYVDICQVSSPLLKQRLRLLPTADRLLRSSHAASYGWDYTPRRRCVLTRCDLFPL
jgi:hypothetical protein